MLRRTEVGPQKEARGGAKPVKRCGRSHPVLALLLLLSSRDGQAEDKAARLWPREKTTE